MPITDGQCAPLESKKGQNILTHLRLVWKPRWRHCRPLRRSGYELPVAGLVEGFRTLNIGTARLLSQFFDRNILGAIFRRVDEAEGCSGAGSAGSKFPRLAGLRDG
jgi:hypothetical protein